MDSFILARIQFGANISFHILFPTITIALGWVLLFFKLRFNSTGDEKWMNAYRFFVKVFALSFALGVVSGITMSFQFGTNWPGFMLKVGNIAGPLLAYEMGWLPPSLTASRCAKFVVLQTTSGEDGNDGY
jgi:cytochrome d ubiquinol oxidase subunit I